VADGVSGLLVTGHDPADYARTCARILDAPRLRAELSAGAVAHAAEFSWDRTAQRTEAAYVHARRRMRAESLR
jgi:D-inositol-3-phosphate glycosyltransferase